MKLFAQLTKVDVEKREVWGRATQEVRDKAKEIFDYETSVPHFKDWSAEFEKATAAIDGVAPSLGNIRAMHGKVAAGKVIAIDFNDAEKAIDIGTQITDDNEWQKVVAGTYTGFSIGGSYEKKWKDADDPALMRYTAQPSEISLVDNPCVPTARFSMVKADGTTEEREFQTGNPAASAPATDVPAEPKALKYLRKGMYSVQDFAGLLQTVAFLAMAAEAEQGWEQDASTVPADLRAWLQMGVELFKKMSAEEADELIASVLPPGTVLEMAAGVKGGGLAKAGARHSKADQNMVQTIHDHSVGLGASCADDAGAEKLAKAAGELDAARTELEKRDGELATLRKNVDDLTAERATLTTRIADLEAQPEPPKGVTKVVPTKAADDTLGKHAPVPDPDDPLALMKATHKRGVVLLPSGAR